MMASPKLIVGGEFVFSPRIVFQPKLGQFTAYGIDLSGYNRYYTFGAYYSLLAIFQDLGPAKNNLVLLPSYLCPSIIEPLRKLGIKYDFYRMKEGLLPDAEDIDRKSVRGLAAILFIDYFGFPQKAFMADTISLLRSKGVRIIQDTVQSWLDNESELYGDYCFNSVRKYSPFEASVLFTRDKMNFAADTSVSMRYLGHKRCGQLLRHLHLTHGCFKPQTFLRHIDKANELYHQPGIVKMPWHNKRALDKLDFAAMGATRKLVHRQLIRKLQPRLVLGHRDEDVVPLGLAVYLEDRDKKKSELHKRDVHCPLHWLLDPVIDKREHAYSWDLQDHALTLPINIKPTQLHEYTDKLLEVLT